MIPPKLRHCLFSCLWLSSAPLVHAAAWELVWADEFNYEGLPDPAKWDYEEGFVRNNELQYYTRARRENARAEGGMLVIEGRHEEFPLTAANPGAHGRTSAAYTSASLITLNKAAWQYGRIEVRAKMPQGNGVWPAIWTLGTNIAQLGWPACGEIDIMEFVGKEPAFIHGTVHYAVAGKHAASGSQAPIHEPSAEFHTYALEWDAAQIDFYVDDRKYHSFAVDKAGADENNPFRKPQYLLLNLALGGSWGGPVDDSNLPQRYLIDYVRVYRPDAKSAPRTMP